MDELELIYKSAKKFIKKTIIKDFKDAINHKPVITPEIVGQEEAEKIKNAKEVNKKKNGV